jgi:hypothetical protein
VGWEDLVCAACAGRVADGRCATCRASRAQLEGQRPTLPAAPFLLAAALLLALLVVLTH